MHTLQSYYRRLRAPYSAAIIACFAIGIVVITGFWSIVGRIGQTYGLIGNESHVQLMEENKKFGFRVSPPTSVFQEWKRKLISYEEIDGFVATNNIVVVNGQARRLCAAAVGPGLFKIIGVMPVAGSTLAVSYAEAEGSVLVSTGLANSSYGGIAEALGKILLVEGTPREVIGVLPTSFGDRLSPGDDIDIVYAIDFSQHDSVQVLAKLRPGTTIHEAQAELNVWTGMQPASVTQNGELSWVVLTKYDLMDSRTLRMLRAAIIGGVVLLAVAIFSLLHLSAAQVDCQRRELVTRWAIGAGRMLLFRWRLGQVMVLSLLSGAIAAALISWSFGAITMALPDHLRFLAGMKVEVGAFLFGLMVGLLVLVTPVLFSNVLWSARDLNHDFGTDRRSSVHFVIGRFVGHLNIVALVATSFVLVVAAYVIAGAITRLGELDVGFRVQGLQSVTVTLPEWRFIDESSRRSIFKLLEERLSSDPRIESVALSSQSPSEPGVFLGEIGFGAKREGTPTASVVGLISIGPSYFGTLRQKIISGRGFSESDLQSGAPVVIVSEATARLMGTSSSGALGRWIQLGEEHREIIGVVADLRAPGLSQSLKGLQVYMPLTRYANSMTILVRVRSEAGLDIQRSLQRVDTSLVAENAWMQAVLADSIAEVRFLRNLFSLLAVLTIVLVIIVVYSALSNFANRQRRQIAIRMAIGASREDVERWVIWKGMSRCLIGVVVGLMVSYPACQLLDNHLFGMEPDSTPARVLAAVLLIAVTACATWVPATRAARTQPIEILKAL